MKRLTIRTRLTLVYGGLFLFAGLLLLTATYALVSRQLSNNTPESTVGLASEVGSRAQAVQEARNDALTALLAQGGIALGLVVAGAIAISWLIAGRHERLIDGPLTLAKSDRELSEPSYVDLVENGVRHNVPDGWVRVTSDTRPDGWVEPAVTSTPPGDGGGLIVTVTLPAPLETVTSAWNSSPPEPGMPGRPWEMA